MEKTVLVVDDEAHIQELIKFNLMKSGFKVLTADNGNDALEVAENDKPDLIFLDLMLPGKDGLEVCKEIRKNPSTENIPKELLNTNTLVSDTIQITDYLIKTFNQPKIFIAGHSWGTIIATNTVKNWPEKYLAYIGIGQFVDAKEGEKISYEYSLLEAKKQNNIEVIEQLEKIGNPPYTADDFLKRAQCLSMLGCVFKTNPNIDMGEALMSSTEYTELVKSNYIKNALTCSKILAPEILKVKFLEDIKELKVPVYFIVGKYDYHTPTAMVEKFYNQLKAPKKELISFENSAHVPQLEENERFNKTIIRILEENS